MVGATTARCEQLETFLSYGGGQFAKVVADYAIVTFPGISDLDKYRVFWTKLCTDTKKVLEDELVSLQSQIKPKVRDVIDDVEIGDDDDFNSESTVQMFKLEHLQEELSNLAECDNVDRSNVFMLNTN